MALILFLSVVLHKLLIFIYMQPSVNDLRGVELRNVNIVKNSMLI